MGERQPLGVEVALDGRSRAADTRYVEAGAYVPVLSSCVAELGVELHSVYVGHTGVSTHVTHLVLHGPPSRAATETVVRAQVELPVVFAQRRCLFDHLQR